MNIPLSTSSREIYGIARDILVNKTRFMDLKQGKVTGERYKLKYSKNKPVFDISSKKNNLTDEEKAIKERAIANGTFMKAPNGKSSNLSEKQWLTVRTKNFKKWFRDWEKSANWKAIKELKPILVTGEMPNDVEAIYRKLENGKNKRDGREVRFVHSTLGKILRHKGFETAE